MSEQQELLKQQDTDHLLASAEANLKTISAGRLSAAQQDTVNQIKNYMEQAKAAAGSGDVQRAHNLASKAEMLSADLARH